MKSQKTIKIKKEKKSKKSELNLEADEIQRIKNSLKANASILEMTDIKEETKEKVRAQSVELNKKLRELENKLQS